MRIVPTNRYGATSKVESKITYYLGIGKSVYMTPTSFKAYFAKHY